MKSLRCHGCDKELVEQRSSSTSVQWWIRDGMILCLDCFLKGVQGLPTRRGLIARFIDWWKKS